MYVRLTFNKLKEVSEHGCPWWLNPRVEMTPGAQNMDRRLLTGASARSARDKQRYTSRDIRAEVYEQNLTCVHAYIRR